MKIKDIIAKLQKGEELTDEEQVEVDKMDEQEDEAETDKQAQALVAKVLDVLKVQAPAIVDEKSILKQKFENKTDDEITKAFFAAVVSGDHATLKALSTGTGSEGGYLIPAAVNTEVFNFLGESSSIRANANVIPNCPQGFPITQFTSLPSAYFVDELAVKTSSQPAFGQQTLTPYTLVSLVILSNKVKKYTNMDVSGIVIETMKMAMLNKEEEVYAAGDGNAKPTGLEEYYAAYPTARKITGGLLIDRLIKADTRLKKQYRTNAKWFMPTDELETIKLLKKGDGSPLFIADMTGEYQGRILGKPVETNDNLSNIWFGDMKSYFIGQGSDIAIAESDQATIVESGVEIHLFQKNAFALRAEMDVDGELANTSGLIAVQGGASDESGS